MAATAFYLRKEHDVAHVLVGVLWVVHQGVGGGGNARTNQQRPQLHRTSFGSPALLLYPILLLGSRTLSFESLAHVETQQPRRGRTAQTPDRTVVNNRHYVYQEP